MADAWIAMVMGVPIFAGSLLSVEVGISVALIEIVLGVVGDVEPQALFRRECVRQSR